MSELQPRKMEFHISRKARDLYRFDDTLFSLSGNVIFLNFHVVRLFTQKMNARRNLIAFPEQALKSGQINAMGLVDEIMHLVIQLYRQQRDADTWAKALGWLEGNLGKEETDQALKAFTEEFPPLSIYRNEISIEDYIYGFSQEADGRSIPNRQIILEEMLVLWLANSNPAFSPYLELFDDSHLEKSTPYREVITQLGAFFSTQPLFGPENQDLVSMLRSPSTPIHIHWMKSWNSFAPGGDFYWELTCTGC